MAMPGVSVVIPVKHSQRTIRRAVDSLLAQDYDGGLEVVLVGDPGDPTWSVLEPEIDAGLVRVVELEVETGGRDANAKRNAGLAAATGDVLCLTDSDMVLPADWIATGVRLLAGRDCVGGPMLSVDAGFWGSYVDDNPLASKTPRMQQPYVVDRDTIGHPQRKLPITANVFFSRQVYDLVGGFDARFVHSYEDYEFFQRVVDAGCEVYCTAELAALHCHRQGWRDLLGEYHRSGRGCAQFIHKHPRSPFSVNRIAGLALLLALTATVLVQSLALAASGAPVLGWVLPGLGIALTAVGAMLGVACSARARSAGAFAFPFVTLALGLSFSAGLLRGLANFTSFNPMSGAPMISRTLRILLASGVVAALAAATAGATPSNQAFSLDLLKTHHANAGSVDVKSPHKLTNGTWYVAGVQGTASYVKPSMWTHPTLRHHRPAVVCGTPESAPMFGSPDGGTGRVGFDPETMFAQIMRPSKCAADPTPRTTRRFQINPRHIWRHPTPLDGRHSGPRPDHAYAYAVKGLGVRAGFRVLDRPTSDNYGVLHIVIRPAVTGDCSGAQWRNFDDENGHPGFATMSACQAALS
jgi:GT2 family glycosyltransferase